MVPVPYSPRVWGRRQLPVRPSRPVRDGAPVVMARPAVDSLLPVPGTMARTSCTKPSAPVTERRQRREKLTRVSATRCNPMNRGSCPVAAMSHQGTSASAARLGRGEQGRKQLVVVGSANADLVVSVARLPLPGETMASSDFNTFPGGKVRAISFRDSSASPPNQPTAFCWARSKSS